jgi:predicted transcriptional regulator
MEEQQIVELVADIVSAHVANNTVSVGDVPDLIQKVHAALAALGSSSAAEQQAKTPAVSVRSSIKPDFLVCLECGRKQKTLKRHLHSAHGLTPEQYRADYGLPRDYPLVAPRYSEHRRSLAHASGLGRRRGTRTAAAKPAAAKPAAAKPAGNKAPAGKSAAASAPKRRGRKPKA